MSSENLEKFKHLSFEGFRELAKDENLSPHEKIGFPDSYRDGKEQIIFNDIKSKMPNLSKTGQTVVDIGPGCGALAFLLIEYCLEKQDTLVLIDSAEMLQQLPDDEKIIKIPAYYPNDCRDLIKEYADKADVVLTYSVFHYVFDEGNLFDFFDASLSMLAVGGEFLIGDIPNISRRNRFFSSPTGIKYHQDFMKTDGNPEVNFNRLEAGQIDDAVLMSMMIRARNFGFDSYILAQSNNLPMANRREDVLIKRP